MRESSIPVAVVRKLGRRVGHCHAKDVVFSAEHLALNGLLDRRWPRPPAEMPWNFAVIGRGRQPEWWHEFVAEVVRLGSVRTLAIEHEDPFVDAEDGIVEAAALLSRSLSAR